MWHTRDLGQEGKGRVGNHKRTPTSTTRMGFAYKYQVAYMISLLVLACMWFLGHDLSLAWRIM